MAFPSLTSKQQRAIEALIRGWSTKLTWERLAQAVHDELNITTTRQTLHTYTGIRNEYDHKKSELRGASPQILKQITQKDVTLAEQVKKLTAENAVQKRQINEQLQLIERILANAQNIPNVDVNALVQLCGVSAPSNPK